MASIELDPKPPAGPSAAMIREGNRTHYVTDSAGRRIGLRRPTIVDRSRMVRLAGRESENRAYMAMMTVVFFVVEIDGAAVFLPKSEREYEATLQRLDDHGMLAVESGIEELMRGFGGFDKEAAKN